MLDEKGTGWVICTARDLLRPGLPAGGVLACADASNVVSAALTPGVSNYWIREVSSPQPLVACRDSLVFRCSAQLALPREPSGTCCA